ncbi:hypothetical protein E2C01_085590 [Portunus trituberculatus]
MVALV